MKHISFFLFGFILSFAAFTQNYNAEVLKYKLKVEYDGKKITKKHQISIQINNNNGLEYASVQIPMPRMQKVKNIEAYLTNLDGKILKKLKKKDLVLRNRFSNASFYSNDFIYDFKLIHNKFPFIINYSYETDIKEYVTIEHWFAHLFSDIPTRYSELKLVVPDSNFIKMLEFNIKYTSKNEIDGNQKEYVWISENNLPIREEMYTPAYADLIQNVIIIPSNFKFHLEGSYESWESFGLFIDQLNKGLNELPENEKSIVLELTSDIESEKEKIRILFDYLKEETRYVNISLDEGGLRPYPASFVSENKYGDCKALSNYFKSLLEQADISSYYTIINAGDNIDKLELDFPSQQFNHVILLVPLDNDSLWIDCTTDHDCGYVGTFIQNRNALIINSDQSYLKKTTALSKEDVKTKRTIYIKDSPSKNAEIKVRNSYKGRLFEHLFYIKNHKSNTDKLEYLQKYFVEEKLKVPDEFVFQTIEDENEIVLDYNTTSNAILNHFGNEMLLTIPRIDFPDFELPEYRDYKVQIDYPIYHEDQIIFEIPRNSFIENDLVNDTISSEFGYYRVNMSIKNNQLLIDKEFYLIAEDYELDQYEELYDFINKSRKVDKKLNVSISKK